MYWRQQTQNAIFAQDLATLGMYAAIGAIIALVLYAVIKEATKKT